jgi:hypothetical protein
MNTCMWNSGTQISKLSFLKHLYNLDTLVLDSCQKIDVKEFENLKFCNQLSNPKYPNYINVSKMITLKSVYLKDLTILDYYYI